MKTPLSLAVLDAQTAVELPERELMALINITIGAIVIPINVSDVNVAVQVCGVLVASGIDCDVVQS